MEARLLTVEGELGQDEEVQLRVADRADRPAAYDVKEGQRVVGVDVVGELVVLGGEQVRSGLGADRAEEGYEPIERSAIRDQSWVVHPALGVDVPGEDFFPRAVVEGPQVS